MTKKEELFREMEEFGYADPKRALETIEDFLGDLFENDELDDERVSDAIKRLRAFVEEVDKADGMSIFLTEEIPFRLKEFLKIENPSQELINYLNFEKLDDLEGYIDNDYMDTVLREGVQEYIDDLKVDIANGIDRQQELEELERGVEQW